MSESPRASVIIPTHQRREALRRALLAFAAQTAAPQSFEVLVSVDGSTDGSRELLAELAAGVPYALRACEGAGRGRAAARNVALASARGAVTILLDDDMEPAPQFVERHLARHAEGSRSCVLGPVPVELDGASPHAARYVRVKFDQHLEQLAQPGHRFVPRDFYSGNVSLPTALLREVGAFDEGFAPYGNEDVELSLRLAKAGAEFGYEPEALARQEYDKDFAGLAGDTHEKGRTTVLLAQRHPDAFADLRLANPWDGSRPWLAARALLLRATRAQPALAPRVLGAAALLERAGLWRAPLFYRASLDYAFWAGVEVALAESTDEGALARLEKELHRGPIDLFLHR
ncbi:MAG TPA: glycosyltransferase [Solirubrobacterales bacterium]|nr:glycosyltransferase [Solirubrobacterales bacterium]